LNGVMALAFIQHYFAKFRSFAANYVTVVEVRPILSVTKL